MSRAAERLSQLSTHVASTTTTTPGTSSSNTTMSDQQKYSNKLSNAHVLVIGGTSGIGHAAAECLLESGINSLTISSSSPDKVSAKVAALQKAYPSRASAINGFPCNLGDQTNLEANLKTLFDQTTDNGSKKLDHIIHTAGDPLKITALADVDLPTLIQAGMVRYFSAIMTCKIAPAYLNPGPASSITMTTGSVSERPRKGWGVPGGYATGLHGVTRGMALDLAPLRVNLVSPGAVATELWDSMASDPAQKQKMLEGMGKGMPTGRVGRVEDVAEVYAYVIRDWNLTGSVVSTNGGALLVGP